MTEWSGDVVVCGGGPVGMTLALALADAGAVSVALIDAKPADAPLPGDERAYALGAAVCRMLDTLDIWPEVEAVAQPVTAMDITDSRLADAVRPVFLTFDGVLDDGAAFAHMVPVGTLTKAVEDALTRAGVTRISGRRVTTFDVDPDTATLTLDDESSVKARLVVAADGGRSALRDMAGIRTVGWDYDQYGLVTTIAHSEPHDGRAEEHFLPSGPFAILPLRGGRSSLVWTERTAAAKHLMSLDRDGLEAELLQRIPPHYGDCRIDGPLEGYPLRLRLARDYVVPRLALVGDAAHSIHPLAGQGLNLGMKDAAALAETVTDAVRIGLDPGALTILKTYERWRRFDAVQFAAVTDVLNRLFGMDAAPLRIVRDVGMGLVDRMPGLKRLFIRESAGVSGTPPKLLRGEVL